MDAIKGMVTTTLASLIIAILFAYLFRIPIPLGGYIGPLGEFSSYHIAFLDVLKSVLVAWVFYGIFGGFIILPLLGAVSGIVIGRKYSGSDKKNKMIIVWSAAVSSVPVFFLAILDYVIGPW